MERGSTLQPFTGRHCPASAEQADKPVPNLQWHGLISRARSALNTALLAEQGQHQRMAELAVTSMLKWNPSSSFCQRKADTFRKLEAKLLSLQDLGNTGRAEGAQ